MSSSLPEAGGAVELDTRGLRCPLPILRAKKMLASMLPGAVLTVLADDPAAPGDFELYCRQTGHVLRETHILDPQAPSAVVMLIQRRQADPG